MIMKKKIVFNDQNYVSQFIINNTYNFICICKKYAFLLVKIYIDYRT